MAETSQELTSQNPSRLRASHLILGLLAVLTCCLVALLVGAVDLGPDRVLAEIGAQLTGGVSPLDEAEAAILWKLRAPRVVLGLLVGASLAVSGAAFQGVFRNPLADPYLLGSSSGAGLAVTLVLALPAVTFWLPVPVAAFAGALGGVALSWTVGRSNRSAGNSSTATLILAGVAVGAFCTAGQTLIQQLNLGSLQQVYLWVLGRLITTGWQEVFIVLPCLLVAAGVCWPAARLLDLLGTGDDVARSLGVRPTQVRALLLGAATLATAGAVAAAGLIGFVGLVVPHVIRLLFGASFRIIVPLSLLFGGCFLLLADLAARWILAPAEVPIGVVTAMVGAPVFAWVLRTRRPHTQ